MIRANQGPDTGVEHRKTDRDRIVTILEQTSWDVSRAARAMGITTNKLRHLIKQYKIELPN